MRYLVPALLLALPLGAQEPARAVIRDSAGITIVENPARASMPVTLRLAVKPVFAVGGLEDDPFNEFDHRQGYLRGVRLSDGGLAVIDVYRVHIFDATGKRVRVMGVKGRGPREFLNLGSICRTRGDTLVVGDSHNRRVTVLHPSGAIVRGIPQDDHGGLPADGCFGDGTFSLSKRLPGPPGERSPWTLRRLALDGRPVGRPWTVSAPPVDVVIWRSPTVAVGDSLHFIGSTERSEVEARDRQGRLVRLIRTADAVSAISDSERERLSRRSYPMGASAAEVKAFQDRVLKSSVAKTWPAWADIKVDSKGRLWMQDYQIWQSTPQAQYWTAFDREGRVIGRLLIPAAGAKERPWQIISFGDGDVVVRTQDADGGAWLGVYRLEPIPQ